MERVGGNQTVLAFKRQIEQRRCERGAPAERRLSAELLEHELFDRIIEEPETGANARLAGAPRTPRETDTRREGFVVGLRQAGRDTLVSRHDESQGKDRRARVAWIATGRAVADAQRLRARRRELAGINRGRLAGPVRLEAIEAVVQRRIKLPAQTVVQGDIRTNLIAVLPVEVERAAAYRLELGRTLCVGVRKAQKVVREQILVAVGVGQRRIVGAASEKREIAVDVEVKQLVELLATDVSAELQRVFADHAAQVVRELIGIADLRQLSFKIVSDDEATGQGDKRNAFEVLAQEGSDAE